MEHIIIIIILNTNAIQRSKTVPQLPGNFENKIISVLFSEPDAVTHFIFQQYFPFDGLH